MTITKFRLHLIAVGLSTVVLIVYLFTLAPSVDFIDTGELAAVTHTLGIAHPTGYPLFTMLGWLWSHLPIGDEIFRMNVFAAVMCAAGVGALFEVIHFMLLLMHVKKREALKGKKKFSSKKSPHPLLTDHMKIVTSFFGALTIAYSETYWSTALSIEVYALHCMLVALVLLFFLRSIFSEDEPSTSWWSGNRMWLLFAFTLGLSFTNHMTTILLAPACLYLFFATYRFSKMAWLKIIYAVPAFILGLLPYVYLPIRAGARPGLNWGNPQTLEKFLWHISGKQYRVWIFSGTEATSRQLKYFVQSFPAEFGYILLPFILIGIWSLYRKNRKLAWFVILLFIGCVVYSINYDIYDIESYFLLAYICSGMFAAFGFASMVRWFGERQNMSVGLVGLCIGILFGVQVGRVNQSGNYLVEDYTHNMFNSFERGALVISYQWDYWVSASYYYQHVKGLRNDVTVIDKELLRRSWYFEQIKHNFPSVYEKSRSEIEAFLIELYKFEHELPYDPAIIEERFNAMINSFIDNNFIERPVYVTVEIEQQFAPNYFRVPEGLAFRLYKQMPPPEKKVQDEFAYRPFKRSGRLIDGINSMYATMLTNRGKFLNTQKEYQHAAKYFERALQFNPADQEALRWRLKNEEMLRAGENKS